LAVDRGNARMAERFVTHHPAVLRQLRQVVEAGEKAGIPVSVCGEMASEPLMAVLLVGLGYHSLSISPPSLPLVKWVLRQIPLPVAQEAATRALAATAAPQVTELIGQAVRPHVDIKLFDAASALLGG